MSSLSFKGFASRQPWMIIALLLLSLVILNIVNTALVRSGVNLGTDPYWFPLALSSGPWINTSNWMTGAFYAGAFFITVGFVLMAWDRISTVPILLLCVLILTLGNLIQGNFEAAFVDPFVESGLQYYHDAVQIENRLEWLRRFNDNQMSLLTHSEVHPPFAVLLHSIFLTGGTSKYMVFGFYLLSCLNIPLMWWIGHLTTRSKQKAALLTVLFCTIPAVNIYSIISLDAIIAALFVLTLAGMILVDRRLSAFHVGIFTAGLLSANLLTFGGTHLFAFAFIAGIYRMHREKNRNLIFTFFIASAMVVFCLWCLNRFFHYDHIRAFLTASASENPDGFRLFSEPLAYLGTRIGGIAELLLFAGIGSVSIFMMEVKNRKVFFKSSENVFVWIGMGVLMLMLLAGAYKTGETARCCLFLYPYALLLIRDSSDRTIKDMIVWASSQTFFMQFFAAYFW